MSKLLFLDTETTGLDTNRCGVYQISGIVDINGVVKEEINLFCDIFEGDIIEEGAFERNKACLELLKTYPKPSKTFFSFIKVLRKYIDQYNKKDKFIMVAYSADFDGRVLRRFFEKNGNEYFGAFFFWPYLDIMQLATFFFQDERHGLEKFRQQDVAEQLGISVDEAKLHDGLYDVKLTREIYYKITGEK
jgi:DNA polymerase-3 subunit epsilon